MRDRYSDLVAKNIEALLNKKGFNRNQIKKASGGGGSTSTAIYDFLASDKASVKVSTLGKWSEFFDVPITAFLMPLDKRDAVLDFLRILDNDESIDPDQAGELVAELLRISKAEAVAQLEGVSDKPLDT